MKSMNALLMLVCMSFMACSSPAIMPHALVSDTARIRNDLNHIVHTDNYRNYKNINILNQVADYIKDEFRKIADSVSEQPYNLTIGSYKNIICSLGIENKERIIVGAHYDVCGDQDGADDNASGVAGLLELARLLSKEHLKYRIDFVAYTLEEPPLFKSDFMGSCIHANYLKNNKVTVKGMVCLEMIGYYNDKPKSQSYPIGLLKWFYGDKGNFITVVQRWGNGKFGKQMLHLMQESQFLPTKSFKAPKFVAGVDFSDHLNYWNCGYSAVMVTNSSFYRNKNYHEKTDKLETLDIKRMALVIDEVFVALKKF